MKKYTLKELEERYDKAVIKTLDELEKDFDKVDEKNELNALHRLAFTMQNALVIAKLKEELFEKESD